MLQWCLFCKVLRMLLIHSWTLPCHVPWTMWCFYGIITTVFSSNVSKTGWIHCFFGSVSSSSHFIKLERVSSFLPQRLWVVCFFFFCNECGNEAKGIFPLFVRYSTRCGIKFPKKELCQRLLRKPWQDWLLSWEPLDFINHNFFKKWEQNREWNITSCW